MNNPSKQAHFELFNELSWPKIHGELQKLPFIDFWLFWLIWRWFSPVFYLFSGFAHVDIISTGLLGVLDNGALVTEAWQQEIVALSSRHVFSQTKFATLFARYIPPKTYHWKQASFGELTAAAAFAKEFSSFSDWEAREWKDRFVKSMKLVNFPMPNLWIANVWIANLWIARLVYRLALLLLFWCFFYFRKYSNMIG